MTSILDSVKIAALKRQAKAALQTYDRELLAMQCGKALAEYINPRMLAAKYKFNESMAQLERLDPTCPKGKRIT